MGYGGKQANRSGDVRRFNFTGNGSNTAFDLGFTPATQNQLIVTVNGLVQHYDAFSISGSTLTFTGTPASGDTIQVTAVVDAVGVAAIPDGAVANVSTLTVSGAATLANTFTVTGNAVFSNTVAVTGNATFSNTAVHTGAATFSNTVTVANSGITFGDASTQTTAATGFGFKNRIINGAMVINQRAFSATVTTNQYTLDRWQATSPTDSGKFSVSQSSTSTTGFSYSLLATSLTAYTVLTNDRFSINQAIEGYNVADLAWGTASASSVTLSFWVRSSLTGTFGGSLTNNNGDRAYPFTFTINSANAFEYKNITIPGPTSGTWGSTNGTGILLFFGLGVGATYSGTAGAWSNADYRSATGATSLIATNGATFYITGVQLEKGSTATAFDWRPYGTELQLCQRYYAKLGANAGGSSNYQAYGAGGNQSTNTSQNFALVFPQYMRVAPTIAYSGNMGVTVNGSYVNITGIGGAYTGYGSTLLQTNSNAVGSAGQGAVLLSNADANAYISLTAEL